MLYFVYLSINVQNAYYGASHALEDVENESIRYYFYKKVSMQAASPFL